MYLVAGQCHAQMSDICAEISGCQDAKVCLTSFAEWLAHFQQKFVNERILNLLLAHTHTHTQKQRPLGVAECSHLLGNNALQDTSRRQNVQQYYQQFEEQKTQSLIDQEVKELLCQTVAAFVQQQIGGAFHQNLATMQSGQYKPLPAPSMPPSMHLIVLQPRSAPTSGYGPVSGGATPTCRPPVTQAPASNGPTPQYYPNGNGPAQPQQQQ